MIQYLDIEVCRELVFVLIQNFLAHDEPVPSYELEEDGIEKLEKVLGLVQQDNYYRTFHEKAAYMICSIAGSQYFSNGNKRLAVATLLIFLIQNDVQVLDINADQYKQILFEKFPEYVWDSNIHIHGSHALFLYNLAIVIGDRTKWGFHDFTVLKERVSSLFTYLYKL